MNGAILSALLLVATGAKAPGHAAALAGKRLIMNDTECAGLEFASGHRVFLYAEMGCQQLETRVRWLSSDTFMVIETARIREECPPRTWVYQVVKRSRARVTLREPWTGWGALKDSTLDYRIVPGEAPEPADQP